MREVFSKSARLLFGPFQQLQLYLFLLGCALRGMMVRVTVFLKAQGGFRSLVVD